MSDECLPGMDPVRADTRRVVLGSIGHLERLQMPWRWRKNIRWGLEKLGFEKRIKNSNCFVFWSIGYPQSTVTLYIYRAGWTYPVRNLYYRSRSIKILIWLRLLLDRSDRSDPPVRPVGPCRTGHSAPTGQTAHGCREDPMRTPHGRIRRLAVGIRSRVCIFFVSFAGDFRI